MSKFLMVALGEKRLVGLASGAFLIDSFDGFVRAELHQLKKGQQQNKPHFFHSLQQHNVASLSSKIKSILFKVI